MFCTANYIIINDFSDYLQQKTALTHSKTANVLSIYY